MFSDYRCSCILLCPLIAYCLLLITYKELWKSVNIHAVLDFSKAFGTVDYLILIKELEKYGIQGIAREWFICYLTNRQHFISLMWLTQHHLSHSSKFLVMSFIIFDIYIYISMIFRNVLGPVVQSLIKLILG